METSTALRISRPFIRDQAARTWSAIRRAPAASAVASADASSAPVAAAVPVIMPAAAPAAAKSAALLESCLEDSFLPARDTLISFLVNALYLFGDQGIADHGGTPEGVTAELTRLGHRVEGRRVPMIGRLAGKGEGGSDRALYLAKTFGRGSDDGILADLKAMRKTVRPGGLICFHVFDRDRAWSLAGDRTYENGGIRARIHVGFDPETGRLTARFAQTAHASERGAAVKADAASAAGEGRSGPLSLKAWNLCEIRALLREAGLELERAYGDWDGGSPAIAGAETGRLIVVAARPRVARPRVARKGAAS